MRIPTTALLAAAVALGGCATTNTNSIPDDPGATTQTTPAPTRPIEVASSARGVLPVGQEIDVRLQTTLSSNTAEVEQQFETTTVVDLEQDGSVLVPAGSIVRGVVSSVSRAGRLDRRGSLTLAFDQITVRGQDHEIRALATQAFESRGIRDEGRKVGAAGAVGAIIGGILDGFQGALIGAAVGGGGVIAATEGKDVELPAGTVVRIRLDSPLRVSGAGAVSES